MPHLTCLTDLVAHLVEALVFFTWLVSHSGLLGLSQLVAELLAHSVLTCPAELVSHLGLAFLSGLSHNQF